MLNDKVVATQKRIYFILSFQFYSFFFCFKADGMQTHCDIGKYITQRPTVPYNLTRDTNLKKKTFMKKKE